MERITACVWQVGKIEKRGGSKSETIKYVYSLQKEKEIVMISICLLSPVTPVTFW